MIHSDVQCQECLARQAGFTMRATYLIGRPMRRVEPGYAPGHATYWTADGWTALCRASRQPKIEDRKAEYHLEAAE